MSDIRRSKTLPASLETSLGRKAGGLPPRRAMTQKSQDALSDANPFSLCEFFQGQPGSWRWLQQSEDGADYGSDDEMPPHSMTARRAVFDFEGMHGYASDSDLDSNDWPETPGGPGNEEEKRIWREDKLGVLRMTSDAVFVGLSSAGERLREPVIGSGPPSRSPSPLPVYPSVGREEPEDMESVHMSMCARRESRTAELIGYAATIDAPPGDSKLFVEKEQETLERSLVERIVGVLSGWV
ncbi:hypothetical protein EXIGLDRAFT_768924 [Exidia glandulosa HHB12029]|uniref:Uncharacterized protein n=1 Tax=Exidia glandulosa HHB12029 TaxID=1314781 RepID=A0A165HUI4_EXIGL|nr:hypothetical protein EXIGLDRAFT_768924 [Exidia glandulosa HHB12029]